MTAPPTRSWVATDSDAPVSFQQSRSRGLSTLLIIGPILLAWYLSTYLGGTAGHEIELVDIDISKVLKQNLALAKHSWEHGVLTHALLELQNPELSVFAGPGHGFDLRNPNPGATLEPFPEGKLPMCGRSGRYDEWTSVKALRYAAGKVQTAKPMKKGEEWWLYREEQDGSAADAASLGWATLLLERAGADDPSNPVAVGRNAYGEAVDEMVDFLFRDHDRGGNMRFVVGLGSTVDALRGIGQKDGVSWAISHRVHSPQMWADYAYMSPPFLAAYAVARQDEKWLVEAVEQIKAYAEVLAVKDDHDLKGVWRHIVSQPRHLGEDICCHDEGLWLTGNAWALAGMVRVLGVLEKWQPNTRARAAKSTNLDDSKRQYGRTELLGMSHEMLRAMHGRALQAPWDDLLENYLDHPPSREAFELYGPNNSDPAGTALVASSIYRLAQLETLEDLSMLDWADKMYNAVARHVDNTGFLTPVASVTGVPSRELVVSTSEAQSFAILMYTARRDCEKLGICKKHASRGGWFHMLKQW